MPSRRRPSPPKPSRPPRRIRLRLKPRDSNEPRGVVSKDKTTSRWRRDTRPRIVRAVISATKPLKWSPALIEAALEELYVDDHFEELLGAPGKGKLQVRQYPQAIAVALILRHSWHPDDLACILRRLGLKVK